MKLNALSQKVIDETFAMYAGGGDTVPNSMGGTVIIHIYKGGDTQKPNGDLDGYYQNLFFKMIVFDVKTMKMYRPQRVYDAIYIDPDVAVRSISVFKDGATCIRIDGGVKYLDAQACTFYKK